MEKKKSYRVKNIKREIREQSKTKRKIKASSMIKYDRQYIAECYVTDVKD